jgi:hypothetical protein
LVSPLATRLFAEVGRAAAHVKKREANKVLKGLVKKYIGNIAFDKVAKGKPFEVTYDLSTLQPNKEPLDSYNEAKEKLKMLGLALQ